MKIRHETIRFELSQPSRGSFVLSRNNKHSTRNLINTLCCGMKGRGELTKRRSSPLTEDARSCVKRAAGKNILDSHSASQLIQE